METEPNTDNVVYLDEYPHLAEKVRLKNLMRPVPAFTQILHFGLRELQQDELRELMEEPPIA